MEEVTQETLRKGVEMHVAGRFDLASQLYDTVIKLQPNHADANHNMGLLKLDTGHDLEALPYLKTALHADTSIAQFWLSYIKALVKLDRVNEATRVLSLAKENGTKGEEFLKLHQQLNAQPIEVELIKTEADASSQSKPNILDTLKLDKALRLANNNAKEGSSEEAKRIYQDILDKFPKNKRAQKGLDSLKKPIQANATQNPPQATINQLINLYNQGQLPEAVDYAEALTEQYPKAFFVWNILGAANKGLGRVREAAEAFKKVTVLNPTYADGINNLGVALQDQGKLEEAIIAYKKALSLNPNYAEAYNNMGNALQGQGKRDEAIEAYNKALSLKTTFAEAYKNLSGLIKYERNHPQVVTVGEMLKRPDLKDDERCQLHYAYAKMKEDLDDLDVAFENYVAGGRLRKKLLSYDLKQDKFIFDQIRITSPKLKEFSFNNPIEPIRHTPIFILGMPRSGSTLVEQIISSHSQVHGSGELSLLSRFGLEISSGQQNINSDNLLKMRNSYLGELRKLSDNKGFLTDKMPHNFLHIGLILKTLPEAKIIHVKRDPAATCWSNFKHYFSQKGLGYSYDLNDTVGYYNLYHELMEFWDQQFGRQIYHLDYDKLTIEQEAETRKLIKYLELDWDNACLSPQENKRNLITASQQQVRKKIYQGSSQVWRKFEPYLNGSFEKLIN